MLLDRVRTSDPLDAKVTITVMVAAVVLSGMYLLGSDLGFLAIDYDVWPREPWRLLTSTLLHAGWVHLIFNIYWLFRLGVVVEACVGGLAASALMVLVGLGASAGEWAFGGSSIGLSGVVYGLLGFLWALDRWHPDSRGVLDARVARFMAAWFLLCIPLTMFDVFSNPMANWAHGFGALLGGLVGWTVAAGRGRRARRTAVLLGCLGFLGIASTVARPYVNWTEDFAIHSYHEGVHAIQRGDFEAARRFNERALRRLPRMGEAWRNLGVSLSRLGRGQEAAAAFTRARAVEGER